MRSVKATAWRHGKLGRVMVPVFLLCAAIIITLAMADVLSKAGAAPGPLQTDDRGFVNSRCAAMRHSRRSSSPARNNRSSRSAWTATATTNTAAPDWATMRCHRRCRTHRAWRVLRTERRCYLHSHRKGTRHQVGQVGARRAGGSIWGAAAAGGGDACVEAPLADRDPARRSGDHAVGVAVDGGHALIAVGAR